MNRLKRQFQIGYTTPPLRRAIASAASYLPPPVTNFIGRRLHRAARTTRRPGLRRLLRLAFSILVGDAIAIRVRDRGK